MYHYADRPGLSTERSREVIAQAFTTSVDGLPGNDGTCRLNHNSFLRKEINGLVDC